MSLLNIENDDIVRFCIGYAEKLEGGVHRACLQGAPSWKMNSLSPHLTMNPLAFEHSSFCQ